MTINNVRYTYRLRPSAGAERELVSEWGKARAVWNHMVAEGKHRYRQQRQLAAAGINTSHIDDKGQSRDFFEFGPGQADKYLSHLRRVLRDPGTGQAWLASGSSVVQQQVVRDFSAARQKAIMDRKNKIPVTQRRALPRFKSRHKSLPSLNYTTRGFSLAEVDGSLRLKLAGGIVVPVVWSRDLASEPKTVRVYQDALGHWYASFVVTVELKAMPGPSGSALGIDWGVAETATTVAVDTSTGEVDESAAYDLAHPRFGQKSAAELARAQKKMARRKRPKGEPKSTGYQKAQREAATVHRRIANQRKDAGHKWAKRVIGDHGQVAVEDFRPKFLAKTTMAKKSADAGIGMLKAILIWQATVAGVDLRLVDPRNTTTDCANCDARTKHRLPLGQRTYTCQHCGVSRPRDKNSAAVMVARAGFSPAGVEDVRPQVTAVSSEAD